MCYEKSSNNIHTDLFKDTIKLSFNLKEAQSETEDGNYKQTNQHHVHP